MATLNIYDMSFIQVCILIFLFLEVNEAALESLDGIISLGAAAIGCLQLGCYLLHLGCCFSFQLCLLTA